MLTLRSVVLVRHRERGVRQRVNSLTVHLLLDGCTGPRLRNHQRRLRKAFARSGGKHRIDKHELRADYLVVSRRDHDLSNCGP